MIQTGTAQLQLTRAFSAVESYYEQCRITDEAGVE